jgi:hypothetical protein
MTAGMPHIATGRHLDSNMTIMNIFKATLVGLAPVAMRGATTLT